MTFKRYFSHWFVLFYVNCVFLQQRLFFFSKGVVSFAKHFLLKVFFFFFEGLFFQGFFSEGVFFSKVFFRVYFSDDFFAFFEFFFFMFFLCVFLIFLEGFFC